MTKHGPFSIDKLEHGWFVSWPGYESVVVNTPGKVRRLFEILFDEMNLAKAQLGVIPVKRDFLIYHIDCSLWYANDAITVTNLTTDIISKYTVTGANFDQESQATEFLKILEKHYIWKKIGGKQWL